MNPVRPNVWANVPPPAQGQGAVKTAAQRAFFDQALGKASGAAEGQPQPAPQSAPRTTTVRADPVQVHAQPVQRMPASQPTEEPTRILRPGSLLDIRV